MHTKLKCPRAANAILIVEELIPIEGTGTQYTDPQFQCIEKQVFVSIERERNTRQFETKATAADVMFLSGRVVKPKHWNPHMFVGKIIKVQYIIDGKLQGEDRARILPQSLTRLGLNQVFGSEIRLEVEVDNIR